MVKLLAFASLVVGIFVAVWVLFVVPAEKRHHQRKLDMVRRRIEQHEAVATGTKVEPRGNDEPDDEPGQRGSRR